MIKVVLFISGGILPVLALATIPTVIYAFMQENVEYAFSLIGLALITFFYNVDYYLKTPDTMWVIVASFLFTILMVMVLGIFILKL